MGLMKQDGPRENLVERFLIAQDGKPSKEQLDLQRKVRNDLYATAATLNEYVEDSREKSLAITKIEEALMWAGKAIFK